MGDLLGTPGIAVVGLDIDSALTLVRLVKFGLPKLLPCLI